MAARKKTGIDGIVYSTHPSFGASDGAAPPPTPPPGQQRLRIRLETKHRGGKTATVVTGFIGRTADLEDLGRRLKAHCGTGGSAKDGEIIIQGDQQAKVKALLLSLGYRL
jgi:translation initiation factor 1